LNSLLRYDDDKAISSSTECCSFIFMRNKKSKVLLIVMTALLLLSISATSYRYLVERDYVTIDDTEEYYEGDGGEEEYDE